MAYNPNTRLLLKFNEAAASTTLTDTSSYLRTLACSGASATSATIKKFTTNTLKIGNPGGVATAGDVLLQGLPANDVFSVSDSVSRRIDFWFYRTQAKTDAVIGLDWQGYQNRFHIGFDSSRRISTSAWTIGGTAIPSLYPSTVFTLNAWHHFRVYLSGNTIKIGADGVEIGSYTHGSNIWPGGTTNQLYELRIGNYVSGLGYDSYGFYARGYLEGVEFLEGDDSWTGGSYTVPTAEPDDAPAPGAEFIFTGANTVQDIASTGDGSVEKYLVGGSTVEDVSSTGEGYIPKILVGSNTVEDCTGSGLLFQGVMNFAEGANIADDITGSGTGYTEWVLRGNNTTDAISSTGSGSVTNGERIAQGANTVDSTLSEGVLLASVVTASLSGSNTVDDVQSVCVAHMLVQGSGMSTTLTLSSGTGGLLVRGSGGSLVETTGAGAGTVTITGKGASELEDMTAAGTGILPIYGYGGNVLDDVAVYFGGYPGDSDQISVLSRVSRVWVANTISAMVVR